MKTSNIADSLHGRLATLYAVMGIAFAGYNGYTVMFMMSKGLNSSQIGTVMAINSLVAIVSQFFWGMLSDKVGSLRRVFSFAAIATMISMVVMLQNDTVLGVKILIPTITFFISTQCPMVDSYTIDAIKGSNLVYSSIRVWMSAFYGMMSFVVGKIVLMTQVSVVYPIYMIFIALSIFMIFRLPSEEGRGRASVGYDLKGVLANKQYMIFVLVSLGMFIPLHSTNVFLPLLIKSFNGGDDLMGIVGMLSASLEIPVFLNMKKIFRRFQPKFIIALSVVIMIIKQFLLCIVNAPALLIAAQAVGGPAYALFLTGSLYYIDSISKDGTKITAQTMAVAIYGGLGGMIASYGGGILITYTSIKFMYWVGLVISIAVSLFFFYELIFVSDGGKDKSLKEKLLKMEE